MLKIGPRLSSLTLGLTLFCNLLGCGDPADTNFIELERAVADSDRIDVSSKKSQENGLFIIDAAAFTIKVQGCSSGYTATLTAAKTKFNVYKNDRNCLARLLDFTRNGKKYTPVAGKDFVTLATNESATFRTSDATDTLIVKIVSQLSSPIQTGDSINFNFMESTAANQGVSILSTVFGAMGRATKSGDSQLNFRAKKAQLLSVDAATGIGRMIFKIDCAVALTKPGNPNVDCANIRLRNLTYLLIKDDVNGTPCTTDLKKCEAYFNATNPLEVRSADFLSAGADGLTNGGFTTQPEAAVALKTPGKINIAPNMLLILTDGKSYQWFNLDLQVNANMYLTSLNHTTEDGETSE